MSTNFKLTEYFQQFKNSFSQPWRFPRIKMCYVFVFQASDVKKVSKEIASIDLAH